MIADLYWGAAETAHAAQGLRLLAMATRNATLSAWARVEAERLSQVAEAGGHVMVLPVMAREPQVRPMTWPRLEDGRDGGR